MYIFILFQSKFAAKILFSKSGGLDMNSHGFQLVVNTNDVINSNGVEYLFDQETTLFRY